RRGPGSADGARAAEALLRGVALRAAVAADEQGIEVVDPFPDEAVQVAQAMDVGGAADGGQRARGRGLVPAEDALLPFRILAGVGPGLVGGSGRFPFEPGRQPRAFALAIGSR